MTIEEIRNKVETDESYNFLKTDEHIKANNGNIDLLTLGGSYAYGTNVETSDIDVRGMIVNTKQEILTGKYFEQIENHNTDTVIYSFKKLVSLLAQCNPNCIEILGCKPEHYIKVSKYGQLLLDNKKLFLSKNCIHTFGGYAISQLRRLENITNKYISQSAQEKHILDTIEQARYTFPGTYFPIKEDNYIKLFIDKAENPEYDTEIFMDIKLDHYPLRDYTSMWNDMKSIVSSYNKLGKRNQRALDHKKIGKHSMHLIRLYMMCLDILEREEIVTYREKEHDELMAIRNGKYLNDNLEPIPEFFEMINDYEKKLKKAAEETSLPEKPNMKEIDELVYSVHESIVKEN